MRIILDTNVLISGIFFSGPPFKILNAWRDNRFELVLSEEIFEEYQLVCEHLHEKHSKIDVSGFLDLIKKECLFHLFFRIAWFNH